jgi:hypothetical protein
MERYNHEVCMKLKIKKSVRASTRNTMPCNAMVL